MLAGLVRIFNAMPSISCGLIMELGRSLLCVALVSSSLGLAGALIQEKKCMNNYSFCVKFPRVCMAESKEV